MDNLRKLLQDFTMSTQGIRCCVFYYINKQVFAIKFKSLKLIAIRKMGTRDIFMSNTQLFGISDFQKHHNVRVNYLYLSHVHLVVPMPVLNTYLKNEKQSTYLVALIHHCTAASSLHHLAVAFSRNSLKFPNSLHCI